jgi:lipoic acid synthetase
MTAKTLHPLPPEYKRDIPSGAAFYRMNGLLSSSRLNTICVSGKCPNRGECFSRGSLAFMILGDTCTRRCSFCAVKTGNPRGAVDNGEPERLARAAAELKLRHAVVTSVTRDDLPDGGASVFASCIRALHERVPGITVEVLTPDFNGNLTAVDAVLDARPEIYNHNIETVERLSARIRSHADYHRSLTILRYVKESLTRPSATESSADANVPMASATLSPREREGVRLKMKTKSGLMLGLGETSDEIFRTLKDLREAGCDYLTIGQYLRPSKLHLDIKRFVPISEFGRWREEALRLGFERVASGPLVRSSYFADQLHTGKV